MQIEFLHCEKPSNLAVSAARTCYFPHGLVKPEQSADWERKESLLTSVFAAGHHTTLQHTHITMMISGISRHLIWRLLHAHPYYNSEQVSQRYAKMKPENFVIPESADTKKWDGYYHSLYHGYESLISLLIPDIERALPKFKKGEAKKRAQEFARYLLPGGMSAYLYHTANVVTLLRYIALSKTLPECESEAKLFGRLIENELLKLDDSLKPLIEHAKQLNVSYDALSVSSIKEKLQIENEKVKVYDVSGCIDFQADANYADVLRVSQMVLDSGVLGGFNSYIKLSLSADAQNQRHRRSPALRPLLENAFTKSYYVPDVIRNNDEAYGCYCDLVEESYTFFEEETKSIGFGNALYALTNAHEIEIAEHNDFSAFHHKAQMRLCFNAQQEIYDIVYEQVRQLKALNVQGAEKLLPPCAVRNQNAIYPICPEGVRFCGIKVWKEEFENYHRII